MSIQSINIGSVADDGTGDPLRTAFGKTNDNFIELESNVSSLNSSVVSLNASVNLVNSNLISTVTSVNTVNSNLISTVTSVNTVNANLISNVSSLTASINLVNANAVVLASNVSSLTANISNILTGTTSFAGNKTFTGNVGIGTSPSAKLDIAGTSSEKVIINMGGGTTPASTAALNIWTNAFGTSTGLSIGFSDGAAGNRGGITFNDIAAPGDWGVPRMDMIQTFGGASEIRSILNTQDTSWAGMKFTSQFGASTALTTSPSFVWNNYLTEQMRISANGFVGIGTASPSAKLDIAETWNNVSTTFTAIRANVTDTSSAAGSLLMDLQVGGVSQFSMNKSGTLTVGNAAGSGGLRITNAGSIQPFLSRVPADGGLLLGSVGGSPPIYITQNDLAIAREAADTLAQRRGTNAQTSRIYNTYTDASNYERGVIGWTANALQIGTEALGTGTRRPININYSTTIDGFARTNVPVLTLSNVGAGNAGLLVGQLQIGYQQDQSRLTAFYTANKGLGYNHGGYGVANQGAHRFSTDSTFGSWVGAGGSVVDIIAPATLTNIFQCRQANDAVVLNVAYSGAITIANTLTQSTEATTLATVTKTQIASFPVASFRSGKLLVQAYDTVTGATQISEILLAHNVNSASHTEYGIVFTGATSIVAYDVDIASANVRLMATRTTTNSTQYKISETLIVS